MLVCGDRQLRQQPTAKQIVTKTGETSGSRTTLLKLDVLTNSFVMLKGLLSLSHFGK